MWPEVEVAKKQKRCELILSGAEITKRIETNGSIDNEIFSLIQLNYLNINGTILDSIPDRLKLLRNLQSLVLHSNRLIEIDARPIVALRLLKVLDLSNNRIAKLPADITKLDKLQSLNLSKNLLTDLPDFQQTTNLTTLNVANNQLTKFPKVCNNGLAHVTEIITDYNSIDAIPNEISTLANSMKVLSMRNNQLKEIPEQVLLLQKLKDFNIEQNPFSDKRFIRVVEKNQFKLIMDFLRKKYKESSPSKDAVTVALDAVNLNGDTDTSQNKFKINIVPYTDNLTVQINTELLKNVRPFFLGCLIENFQWTSVEIKKFIHMQTRLHSDPLVCDKRLAATIATHDFDKIDRNDSSPNLVIMYTAKIPQTINIQPLNRAQSMTGSELYKVLKLEADQYRKEKKRNTVSGVHRYLHLLAGKSLYPCVLDGKQSVISLPPITNSEKTKITVNTRRIFVEVTSSQSMEKCRQVIETVVRETIAILSQQEAVLLTPAPATAAVAVNEANNNTDPNPNSVDIRQIRVTDHENQLRTIFPSRNDLETFDNDKFILVRQQRSSNQSNKMP